jgi:endonuclease YncB( thermonuclease family)
MQLTSFCDRFTRVRAIAARVSILALVGAIGAPALSTEASAAPSRHVFVQGTARVIDGDTLDVAGERVRLFGIDAPELQQTCGRSRFGNWSCGVSAKRELKALTAGRRVVCLNRGRDRYQRILALCYANGREINAELVRRGLAWAFVKYATDYVDREAEARRSALGIWQGPAQPAWRYRETRWMSANKKAPSGCPIKGNITRQGKIYHTPWSPWYHKTRIEPDKGERWFCNEREALNAGWRPSLPGE